MTFARSQLWILKTETLPRERSFVDFALPIWRRTYVLGAEKEKICLFFLHDASTRTKARQRSPPLANVGAGEDGMRWAPRQVCYVIWLGRSVSGWSKLCVLVLGRRTNFNGRLNLTRKIRQGVIHQSRKPLRRPFSHFSGCLFFKNKEKSAVLDPRRWTRKVGQGAHELQTHRDSGQRRGKFVWSWIGVT